MLLEQESVPKELKDILEDGLERTTNVLTSVNEKMQSLILTWKKSKGKIDI